MEGQDQGKKTALYKTPLHGQWGCRQDRKHPTLSRRGNNAPPPSDQPREENSLSSS